MAHRIPSNEVSSVRVAVVQMCSTMDLDANVERAEALVRGAAADGAVVVGLPENFAWLRTDKRAAAPVQTLDGPVVRHFAALARSLGIHVLLGSVPLDSGDPTRPYNASVWLDPCGEVAAVYRKLHLFDVEIPGRESHRESTQIAPGDALVLVDAVGLRFGLSICYDLRFPELYRRLVEHGANVLCVPAAFTLTTGKDHWHALLRARAIEDQCYVLAPAQWGHHGGPRNSYGHALVCDPWGTVVAEVPDGEGWAVARVEPARIERVRAQVPSLQHRRAELDALEVCVQRAGSNGIDCDEENDGGKN